MKSKALASPSSGVMSLNRMPGSGKSGTSLINFLMSMGCALPNLKLKVSISAFRPNFAARPGSIMALCRAWECRLRHTRRQDNGPTYTTTSDFVNSGVYSIDFLQSDLYNSS